MNSLDLKTAQSPQELPGGTVGMVTALFRDRSNAELAFDAAISQGYQQAEISVVMSGATRERLFPPDEYLDTDLAAKATEKSDLGGPFGGTLATIAAAVGSAGVVLLLPGLGIVVAGPIAAALAGATAVAIAGGLIGTLHDWGIPNERIREYESGIKAGGILLGVRPHSGADAAYIAEQWNVNGGEHVFA